MKMSPPTGRSKQRPYKMSPNILPKGFRFAATACGLKKKGGLDLALISSDAPAAAAAVFTQNLVQAAPVVLSRAHVHRSAARMRAIIVNSGNANCCTGTVGMKAAEETARSVAKMLGCKPEQVMVCSTGVIGVPLRVEKILRALPDLARAQATTPRAYARVTRAIMTTDTRPKWAAAACTVDGGRVRLLGCAKGAGMIHPQMATMLAFVLTDAAVAPALLGRALREVVGRTFNCISVDGDTSTNDTLAIFANGASGVAVGANRSLSRGEARDVRPRARTQACPYQSFVAALEKVCRALALQIVADGEGARRVVQIDVRGTRSDSDADRIARTIGNSPLVKTALAGADPNWGRILAAAGRAGVKFNPARAEIWLAGIKVYARGLPLPFDERVAHRAMLAPWVPIVVDLHARPRNARTSNSRFQIQNSRGSARLWTCDFTAEYVDINASYRT